MRTSTTRVIRCESVVGNSEKSSGKRQPWLCAKTRLIGDVALQYNQFWESVLADTSRVEAFYDNELSTSGTKTEIATALADDTAWKAKLAEMDAKWAKLDAQRAAENEGWIAAAEATSAELAKSVGELALLRAVL